MAVGAERTFPERIGRYELLIPIASGGMATVYLARQRGAGGFERHVALKLTHAHLREQPEWAREIVEEAKLAARIQHPNVVQVIDVDDSEYGVFLVMQYIEGDTLGALIRHASAAGESLPLGIGVRIVADSLAGLHAAHELRDADGVRVGLVHRDFSPQNILVGLDGIAHLADFGVAKAASRAGHTRTGTIKGKFAYMSPEQVRDQPLDRRSDVFAAGVVAWEVIAGRRLYGSGEHTATLLQIVSETAPRLRTVRPDIPRGIEDAVASALVLDRDKRCPTAEDFRNQLLDALRESSTVPSIADVSTYVRDLVEPMIVQRRARAAEVEAARDQPPSTTGAQVIESASSPAPRRTLWITLAFAAIAGTGLTAAVLARSERQTAGPAAPPTGSPAPTQIAPPPIESSTAKPPATAAASDAPSASPSTAKLHATVRPPRAQPSTSASSITPKLHESPYEP